MNDSKKIERIGAIGDIHAEDQLLKEAIEFIKKQNVELIISTGDIPDGPGSVDTCYEILINEKIITVSGNHDRWFINHQMRDLPEASDPTNISDSSRLFLSSLPKTYEIETGYGLLLLCHGLGKNDMAQLKPGDYGYAIEANEDLQHLINECQYRFVINGHTHSKMVRSFGNLVIINAGTLKFEDSAGFLIIDFEYGFIQFYEFRWNHSIVKVEKIILDEI